MSSTENIDLNSSTQAFKLLSDSLSVALVAAKRHRSVFRVTCADGVGVYLKIFHPRKFRKRIGLLFHIPQGCREYLAAKYLAKKGVATPRAISWCTLREGVIPSGSLYLNYEIKDALTLAQSLVNAATTQDTPLRLRLLQRYAELLAKLHQLGIYINDFHAENILVHKLWISEGKCYLIDLESARPFAGYLRRWRELNLGTALYSGLMPQLEEEEISHFYCCYLQAMQWSVEEQSIAKLAEKVKQRKQHRDRRKKLHRNHDLSP
jgi:tRNA A-37 threonylcarbamoyl transferase component Bud32